MDRSLMQKPEYRVMSMEEIKDIPWNEFSVISTFSGCGGSCLGYRMAGFKVLWANEFIPAAQEVYKLNHPESILNTRDIRGISPNDILKEVGINKGEIDLLDGSPPCASFSTAGKRDKSWGTVKKYSDTKQRVDDLFFEYARILKGLQPKVFIAENVSGLVKGVAKGYFKIILKELKDCGYHVKVQLLDAQWLGVPQARQRIIFMGTRKDLKTEPSYPSPLPYRYSVKEAIPWIIEQRKGKGFGKEEWISADISPSQTIGTQPSSGNNINNGANQVLIDKRIFIEDTGGDYGAGDITNRPAPTVRQAGVGHLYVVEPETDIENYAIGKEWDRLKQGEKGKYLNFVKASVSKPSPCITQVGGNTSAASVTHPFEKRKFSIAELKRICAFPDDFKLTGTYSKQWERLGRAVPPIMMYQIAKTVRDNILNKLNGHT